MTEQETKDYLWHLDNNIEKDIDGEFKDGKELVAFVERLIKRKRTEARIEAFDTAMTWRREKNQKTWETMLIMEKRKLRRELEAELKEMEVKKWE